MNLDKRILIIVGLVLLSLGIALGCVSNLKEKASPVTSEQTEISEQTKTLAPDTSAPDTSAPDTSKESIETEPIETEPVFDVVNYVNETYSNEIMMLARLVYCEGRGVASQTEQACIIWTVLNRVDAYGKSISETILAPHQFSYKEDAPFYDDFDRDLRELARDVLQRWTLENMGEADVGRVLPSNYLFFAGKNGHNWFRMGYTDIEYWDYSFTSPYNS